MVSGISSSTPRPDATTTQETAPEAGKTVNIEKQSAQTAQQVVQEQASQAADQAADQAEQANRSDMAQQTSQAQWGKHLLKGPEKHQALSFEFLDLFETIFQEGYETYKTPKTSEGAGVFTDARGQEFQKDLQVLRQFIREVRHLLSDQGADTANLLPLLKTQQGGKFWQRLQQVLQKGLPGGAASSGKGDLEAMKALKKTLAALGFKEGEGEARLGEAGLQNPGRAILEMLRAEANPKGQMESMVLALAILKQEGLKDSSEKLISYMRNRWGLSEEEMRRFLKHYHLSYFQGPMPREERKPAHLWQIFLVVLSFPLSLLLGLDFSGSLIVAGLVAALLVILTLVYKK